MAMNFQRLTEPLVRARSGALRTASWSAALDSAAEGFARVKTQQGGDALGIFSCSKASNEVNCLASNVDSCNRT